MKLGMVISGLMVGLVVFLGVLAIRDRGESVTQGSPALLPNPSTAQVVAMAGVWRVR